MNRDGWTMLARLKKWHYFRRGQSLCRGFALLDNVEKIEPSLPDSPDMCRACRAILLSEGAQPDGEIPNPSD